MKAFKSVLIKVTCMLALVLVSNSFSLIQAQPMSYDIPSSATKGDIRFIDAKDGMLVFELDLENLPVKGSRLRIMDEVGNTLFEQGIKTTTYNKRYKIERNNISKIVFEVTSGRTLLNRSFSINTRIEERVEVAKL